MERDLAKNPRGEYLPPGQPSNTATRNEASTILAGLRFVSSDPAATAVAMEAEPTSTPTPTEGWKAMATRTRLANMDPLNRGRLEAGLKG